MKLDSMPAMPHHARESHLWADEVAGTGAHAQRSGVCQGREMSFSA